MSEPTFKKPSDKSYAGADRRTPTAGDIADINRRLDKGDKRMSSIEVGLTENTVATKQQAEATAGLVELFQSWSGAFKTIEQIGKVAKPIGVIAMACASIAAFFTAIKTGNWGK
jgi:hypothetical protein